MKRSRMAVPPDATIEAFRRLYADHPDQKLWVYKNEYDQFQYMALHSSIPPPEFWRSSPNHPWDQRFKLHGWLRLKPEEPAAKREVKRRTNWGSIAMKVFAAIYTLAILLFSAICGASTRSKK